MRYTRRKSQRQAVIIRTRLLAEVLRAIDEAQARVVERADEHLAVIRACVADDDELPVGIGLQPHALDRVAQHFTAVVGGGDD